MSGRLFPRDEPSSWDPGRSLGIIGLIFSVSGVFFFAVALIGAVICTVALLRSRKAGFLNKFAIVGIVVGLAFVAINAYLFFFTSAPGS